MVGYLCVAFGGALGSVARYWTTVAAARAWGDAFPWGTIAINVVGSFIIGAFAAFTLPGGPFPGHANLRLLVMVGFCGGYTTFSAYSLQTLLLLRGGDWFGAIANTVLSVVLCLLAVAAGHALASRI